MVGSSERRWFMLILILSVLSFSEVLADKIADLLSKRPAAGFGFLSYVDNQTDYSANARASATKGMHDVLTEGTDVFIKSFAQENAYFTVKKVNDIPTICLEIINPSTDAAAKARATFTVHRYLSYDLSDWIGFSHLAAAGKLFAIDANSGDVQVWQTEQVFKQEDLTTAHWELVGSSIGDCWIQNRCNSGCFYFFKGKKDVVTTPEQHIPLNDVWAITGIYTQEQNKNENNVPISYGAQIDFTFINQNKTIFHGLIVRDGDGKQPDPTINSSLKYGEMISLYNPSNGQYLHQNKGADFGISWERSVGKRERWVLKDKDRGGNGPVCYGQTITLKRVNDDRYIQLGKRGVEYGPSDRRDHQKIIFYNADRHIPGVWLKTFYKRYSSSSIFSYDFANSKKNTIASDRVITQIALKDTNDSWGIDKDNNLCHFDGKRWVPSGNIKARSVSVSSIGDVWYVDDSNTNDQLTIMHGVPDKVKNVVVNWSSVEADSFGSKSMVVKQVAACKDICFFIMGDDEKPGMVYVYEGTGSGTNTNFPDPDTDPAVSISAARDDGTVWAVTQSGTLYGYDKTKSSSSWVRYTSPSGAKLSQVAAKTKNDIWAIDVNRVLWHFTGETAWEQVKCGPVDYVACAVGNKNIPAVYENKYIETASTLKAGSKNVSGPVVSTSDPEAHVSIEIVKLGQGGGIKPHSGLPFHLLPMTKEPHVTGFSLQVLPDFNVQYSLRVNSLLSIGTAWIDTAMKTPGKCTVSFLAKAQSDGDIQLVFGQRPNDNFVWRIAFGAQGNQGSTITRRTFNKNGEPQDNVVCQVMAKQNPNAAVVPGTWGAYWASIDDGLILAGSGNIGENVFMAWRDPNPPSDVNYLGFGSHKQPVEYTQVTKEDESVNIQAITRIYKTFPSVPQKTNVLFRVPEEGSIGFTMTDENPVTIKLSSASKVIPECYKIYFDHSKGIYVYKSNKKTKHDEQCALLEKYAFKRQNFWVSYDEGNLFIGDGDITKKDKSLRLLLVFQDPNPISGIRMVSSEGGQISNVAIAPQVMLALGKKTEGYQFLSKALPFSGGVTIVIPFDYKFSQIDKQVFIENLVVGGPRPVAAIPQQGAKYNFRLTLGKNGEPSLVLNEAPSNPYSDAVDSAIREAEAAQTLAVTQQDIATQQGIINQAKKMAQSQKLQKDAAETMNLGTNLLASAGTLMGTGGAVGAIIGGVMTGAGMASQMASSGIAFAANAKAYEGDMAATAGQEQALKMKQAAAQAQFQIDISKGSAANAFRANDSYVFTEQIAAPTLAATDIPDEAQQNQKALADLLSQTMTQAPVISQVQEMIDLITNYYVVSNKTTKKQLQKIISSFCERSKVDDYKDLISLLFSAYNNAFLADLSIAYEADLKEEWLAKANQFARELLKTSQEIFSLDNYFGEYIWLPITQPIAGSALFTFLARGKSDLLVGFSPVYGNPIRNSHRELYEIVIGGWDGSKSAIRLESLGNSIQEVSVDANPNATLNSIDFVPFWINVDNGRITVGRGSPGDGVFLSWIDPYPPVLNYIGLSSWNSKVDIKDWKVLPALKLSIPEKLKNKVSIIKTAGLGVTKKTSVDEDSFMQTEQTQETELAAIEKDLESEVSEDIVQDVATVVVPVDDASNLAPDAKEEDFAVEA